MPSELQRVAQELLAALNQIERIVPYLHERAQKYREAAAWVDNTSNNPSPEWRRCNWTRRRAAARKRHTSCPRRDSQVSSGVQQMVSGIRTAEPSGCSTGERKLGPGGSAPPADRRQDDDEAEPEADKPDEAEGAGDQASLEDRPEPTPRISEEEAVFRTGSGPEHRRGD